MKHLKDIKYIYLVFILMISINTYSQVGVNTMSPTSALDINGDLRIRNVTQSTSTDDSNLVVDGNGLMKTSLVSATLLRGYLNADFVATNGSNISKVNNFKLVDGNPSLINSQTGVFTPDVSGIYAIASTLTLIETDTITAPNIVCGIVDDATGKWILRYSIPKQGLQYMGTKSSAGVTYTFKGAATLTKGMEYSFGITQNVKIIARPSGLSGDGLGTYLSVQLLTTDE